MKWIVAWLAAALPFGLLDFFWLRWAGPNFYRPALGDLLAESFRPAPALVFYVAYISAIVWFAVRPGLKSGFGAAALNGALFGAIAYATYDLTNQATLRVWPVHVTVVDICWGALATMAAAVCSAWVTNRFAT